MKKICCLLLTLTALCAVSCTRVKESPEPVFTPPTVAPEAREKTDEMEYMGLHFYLYNDYTCELASPSETAKHESTLTIPEKCEDYTVVRILKNAFAGTAFTEITIPDTVVAIDESAFQKSDLRTVTLPKSLKTLGAECFDNCLSLEKVTFQSAVEIIPTGAFYGCEKLREIVLPEGVKTIGEEAFASLKNLEKLTLPESLETIGAYAFWSSGTEALEITVPKGVKTIGEDAFASSKAKITYLNGEASK